MVERITVRGTPTRTERQAAPAGVDKTTSGVSHDPGLAQASQLKRLAQTRPSFNVEGRFPSAHWAWTERLHDPHPELIQRDFLEVQKQPDADNVRAFGTETPSSSDVLLHYAGDPPAGVPVHPRPVLLVHGAAHDSNYFKDGHDGKVGGGLADHLRQQGFKVYAVTFAHNQDDNFFWAQQINNAKTRIKTLEKVDDIDMVAHSKGGQAAQMVVSDFRQPWMTAYPQDVHRVVFVAAPLGGIDYSFRHPAVSLGMACMPDFTFNAPTSWDRTYYWGLPKSTTAMSFGAGIDGPGPDYFPGQRQILGRWDESYPLPRFETDWKTTYYGGQGVVSHGEGIEHYIDQGGDTVEKLQEKGIQPGVEVAVLAGDRPNLPSFYNEETGPSDGLLFTKSATALPPGANLLETRVLPLNHMDLVRKPAGMDAIADLLSRP
ncbi:MAG TPA: hypothetical protein VGO93_02665 [Candidatus Xenobia bacterium]|jgi:hypothetical protein